ncbi:MAG: peroxidase family protein, partial [Propionicimonas sp.]
VPRAIPDPTWDGSEGAPPTWVNEDTHWWDGSQVYGDTRGIADGLRAREDGKLLIDEDGLPPASLEAGLDPSGVAGNFWLGLGLLHGLFMREHNAICDLLRKDNPGWGDDRLYRTARLINTALMAKIHTVEWTPGIIAHPTTVRAMRTTWWGLAGEGVHNRFGRISRSDLISGIPGSRKNLFDVPYALTEEFGAVYRMHPLIPDDYTFRSVADDSVLAENTFQDLMLTHVRERTHTIGMGNALYSFGRSHPGAITLHNYPRFLQHLERPDGTILDLAAVDILRSRERGVRRYNEFRRQLHLKPAASFEELTPNREWQSELRQVYDNNLEMVDLTVGLFAETPPPGMGFSDTAFRIFALMAPRRIASDRFLTDDYRPEIYTAAGLDWVDDNTMKSVLLRHFPQLEPALRNVTNAFAPWQAVG